MKQKIDQLNAKGNFIYFTTEDEDKINKFLGDSLHERIIKNILLQINGRLTTTKTIVSNFFQNNMRISAKQHGQFINGKYFVMGQNRPREFQFPQKLHDLDNFAFNVSAFHYPPKVTQEVFDDGTEVWDGVEIRLLKLIGSLRKAINLTNFLSYFFSECS